MYESISKNNELENEMILDMSYFWYSDAFVRCSSNFLKYCTPNWLLNVWEFLISIHGTIHLQKAWKLELQRTNASEYQK